MAKDPAVLFYYTDFLVGTEFMSDEETGKYIRILCHQADKGRLTKKQVLSVCKANAIPELILEKLKVDENGLYYNERMEVEKVKRSKFVESRKKSALSNNSTRTAYAQRMEDININENINVINKGESAERGDHLRSDSRPTLAEVTEYFTGLGYPATEAENFWSYYDGLGWETARGGLIRNWQSKVMGWMNNSKQFSSNNGNGKEQKQSPVFQQKKTNEVKKTILEAENKIKREGKFKSFKEYSGVINNVD